MSGYQYTYPADTSYLNVLPDHQRQLALTVLATAREDGADLADVLRVASASASAADKAAVAAVWGGPEAAREFLP